MHTCHVQLGFGLEGMLIPWPQAKLRYTWQWKPAIDYTAVSQLLTRLALVMSFFGA